MAFRPLRQKRFDYVESIKLDPQTNLPEGVLPDEQSPTHHSPLNTMFDKIADFISGEPDDRPKYLVKLQEHDESHLPWYRKQGSVTWIEKATQRDFAIGSSLGALAGVALVAASGGAIAAGAIGIMALSGAVIGGVSDYINNSNEIENGAIIEPPTEFNRDTVKSALKWAGLTKLTIVLGTVALSSVGIVVPPIVPELLTTVAMGAAAVYGAVVGSQEGYERMRQEYVCAVTKNQRPELGVSIKREIGGGVEDLALGAAGIAVASSISPMVTASSTAAVGTLPMVTQQVSNAASVEAQTETTTKWRDQYAPLAPIGEQQGFSARIGASAQMGEGGYQELIANQPRGNLALQAS